MRWLILVCAILAGCASTTKSEYIRSTGSGSSFEEAKQTAFRDAIEYKIGTLVLSERESTKYDLIKNQILVHSAGYVDDYKVINTSTANSQVTVTVDVLIAQSKITNQIIATSKSSSTLDGQRHEAQYSTLIYERKQGDKILDNIIRSYPMKAYTIKQLPYTVSIDNYRNMVLNVPYELSWNYQYIVSLRETLNTLEDGSNGLLKNSPGNVTIMVKNPKDIVIGERSTYRFNDMSRVYRIQDGMTGNNELRIKMTISDYGRNTMLSQCWAPTSVAGYGSFYGIGSSSDVKIFGNHKEKNTISTIIPSNLMSILNQANNVELSVVAQGDCQK